MPIRDDEEPLDEDSQDNPYDVEDDEPREPACQVCGRPIDDVYYMQEDRMVCDPCRSLGETYLKLGSGFLRFVGATLLGSIAALGGAIFLYAFGVFTGLAVGYLTLLVAFVIGTAVMKASGGRGGRVYQVMAALLTYSAVAWSFAPHVVTGLFQNVGARQQANAGKPVGGKEVPAKPRGEAKKGAKGDDLNDGNPRNIAKEPPVNLSEAAVALLVVSCLVIGLTYVSPFLGLPHSLFVLVFIFVGMRLAWSMTQRAAIVFRGPFSLNEHPLSPNAPS